MSPRSLARSFFAVFFLSFLCGCEVPAAIMYKVMGPPPIPPRYTPASSPVLVLVEGSHGLSATSSEAEELARIIYDDLSENKVGPLVPLDRVGTLRGGNPLAFTKMSISEIGRQVGAKEVIYINLRRCDFEQHGGSDMIRLRIDARIKVVDTTSSETRWPDTADGEPFEYESPYMRLSPEITQAAIRQEILNDTGLQIGRMFHSYVPATMGEENADQKLR